MEQRHYNVLVGSFLLAVLLWLTVTLGETYTARFAVPVSVASLPRDLAIQTPLPRTVDLELEGPGWQLLYLSLSNQLVFDIPAAALRRERVVLGDRMVADALKLPQGVQVLQVFPDTLIVRLDAAVEKKVPVRLVFGELAFREGYGQIGEIYLDPDSVTLTGTARILRGIDSWPAERRSFTDLTANVTETIPLADSLPGLVKSSADRIRVFIPVEQLADVRFSDVAVEVENVPNGRDVLLARAHVDVYVRGGVQTLSTLRSEDFKATIQYSDLVADTTGTIRPRLQIPAGTVLLRMEPPGIEYTIRK